jgi:hypothetical protein
MRIWKLRKYLRGSTVMHGSHTHQSVRNAKSTRGNNTGKGKGDTDASKGGRGMMGVDYFFFTSHKRFVDEEASKIFTRVYNNAW